MQNSFTSQGFVPEDLEIAIKEEVYSPHILPYKRNLITFFVEKIVQGEEKLEKNAYGNFSNDILMFELDRMRFALKKYLRTRLWKIEKQLLFIFQNDLAALLSKQEFNYAVTYYQLISRHFTDCFFSQVAEKYGSNIYNTNIQNNSKGIIGQAIVDPPRRQQVCVRAF